MITLNASGGSVTFTFSGNSTYLNDGTITVPVNSLALIIDESDMISFKKANSNDIFVSANIAEFGMTKDELIAWYKENMVGETGGGVDSGTVQTMIDKAVSGKMDTSAYTVDASVNSASTNPVQNQALYDELRIGNSGETETTLFIANGESTNYPSGCTKLKVEVVGSNNFSTINFHNDNQNLGAVNILNFDSISVDTSSFQGATYEISGTTVILSYPTVTDVIKIVTSVDNTYVFKAVTTETEPPTVLKDQVVANTTALGGKVNVSDNVVDAYSYYIPTDDYSNPDYTYDSGIISVVPRYCRKLRVKLKGSLGNNQLFYRLRVRVENVDPTTNIKSYLSVSSNESGKFSSAYLSDDTYCTATVDSDGILWLEGKNGYGFMDFRANTNNTIEVIAFPYYDVESGQTADALNDSVVKNINVLKNLANGLATKSQLDAKANASEVMTLDKSKENELITAAALNSINERLIALETAVQTLQTLHNNE